MESRQWTGDDDRAFGPEPTCQDCGCPLYPEERADERCRRCTQDALESEANDRSAA